LGKYATKKKKMLHFVLYFHTIAVREMVARESLALNPIRRVDLTMGMNHCEYLSI
jgi:hypothetical protein